MKKKHSTKKRVSYFDHALFKITIFVFTFFIIIGCFEAFTGSQINIYGVRKQGLPFLQVTFYSMVLILVIIIEIYLKPKAYSNIQLKEDGVYWKSVWGRTYVYFAWSEIRQAGFADGISMTNKVKDIDEAMKESLKKRGDTAVYISTRNIEDREAMEKALEVTAKKGRGLLDMLEKDSEEDVYFICFEARAKKKEEIKQEILQYMDESKWARPMDIEGDWKEVSC